MATLLWVVRACAVLVGVILYLIWADHVDSLLHWGCFVMRISASRLLFFYFLSVSCALGDSVEQ